ncbi:MAG: NfeD family protein [Defluviitaleaceae bacterium]|nr:NfeD family protein [Defluviitaleaceae bacterium]
MGKIILRDTLGEDPSHNLAEFIGKTGITATRLRPYGEAEFGDVRMEVSSGGPLIEQGTKIRGVTIRESTLIVAPCNQ